MNVKEQTLNLLNRAVGKSHKKKFVFFSLFFVAVYSRETQSKEIIQYNAILNYHTKQQQTTPKKKGVNC